MGTSLTGNNISQSYLGLLKSTDSQAISSTVKRITDGNGNDLPLSISTSTVRLQAGTSTAPSLSFGSNSEGFYVPSDENVGFVIAGSEKIRLNSDGLSILNSKITLNNDQKIRWSSDDVYIQGTTATDNIQIGLAGSTKLTLHQTTGLTLAQYGSGSITGTVTQRLGVTSSGQVVEIPIGGGAVDGSGTAGKIVKWSDSDTITDSIMSESGSTITMSGGADTILQVVGTSTSARLDLQTNSHHRFWQTIESDGRFRLYNQTTGSEQFTVLSDGKTGIGTSSPDRTLTVIGVGHFGSTTSGVTLADNSGIASVYGLNSAGDTYKDLELRTGASGTGLYQSTSGNVGIGVVPESTWYTGGQAKALQIGGTVSIFNLFDTRAVFSNNYYLTTDGSDTYINTDEATQYYQEAGQHIWKHAPSGTADTTITWSESMRLDSSGNLIVGGTSASSKLHIEGAITSKKDDNVLLVESTNAGQSSLDLKNTEGHYRLITDGGELKVFDQTDSRTPFLIDTLGNSTFTGDITLDDDLNFSTNGFADISNTGTGAIRLRPSGTTTALTISSSDATFNGNIITSSSGGNKGIKVITATDAEGFLVFGDSDDNSMGGMAYNNATDTLDIDCNNAVALSFDSSRNATFAGDVTIQNSSPQITLLDTTNNTDALIYSDDNGSINISADENNEQGSSAIKLYIDGGEKARLDSSGLLGLGTSSPDAILHIQSASATGALLNLETTHTGGIPIYNMKGAHSAQLRYQDENGNNQSRIDFNDGGDFNFIKATDGTSHLKITSAGDVGIGESSPSNKLVVKDSGSPTIEINGQGRANSLTLGVTASESKLFENSNNALAFGTNNSERMRISSDGNVGISTDTPDGKLDVAGNVFLANYSGTGENMTILAQNDFGQMRAGIRSGVPYIGSITSLDFALYTGNTERMRITSGGNVGIGESSPDEKLSVNGNIFLQGNDDYIAFNTSASSGHPKIKMNSDADFSFLNTAGTNLLHIENGGNVGISTDLPSTKLDVNSGISSSSANVISISQNTTGAIKQAVAFGVAIQNGGEATNASDLFISTASGGSLSERLRITSGGNMLLGSSSGFSRLTVSNGASTRSTITISDQNTASLMLTAGASQASTISVDGTHALNFNFGATVGTDGGSTRMTILNNGNVGIGEVSPDSLLTVGGDFTATTTKPTASVSDTTNGGSLGIRGLSPILAFDKTSSGVPKILMDGGGLEFKDGTLDSQGSVHLKIDSNGNVGINESNPLQKLHVNSGSGNSPAIFESTDLVSQIWLKDSSSSTTYQTGIACSGDNLIFNNGGERMRIDSSGTVSIPSGDRDNGGKGGALIVGGNVDSTGTTTNTRKIGIISSPSFDNTDGNVIMMANDSFDSSNIHNLYLGSIYTGYTSPKNIVFITADAVGGSGSEAMRIMGDGDIGVGTSTPTNGKLQIDSSTNQISIETGTSGDGRLHIGHFANGTFIGTYGDDGGAGDLIRFGTHSGDERMRITSGGDVHISRTTDDQTTDGISLNERGLLRAVRTDADCAIFHRLGTDGDVVLFRKGSSTVGSVSITTTATSYNTSSDYRLKEDLQDFNALDIASKIKMYDFKWKENDSRSYGVMAHELEEVLPQAVSGEKDAEEMQSVDYSKLVPILLKSIQELKAEIDELKKNK